MGALVHVYEQSNPTAPVVCYHILGTFVQRQRRLSLRKTVWNWLYRTLVILLLYLVYTRHATQLCVQNGLQQQRRSETISSRMGYHRTAVVVLLDAWYSGSTCTLENSACHLLLIVQPSWAGIQPASREYLVVVFRA